MRVLLGEWVDGAVYLFTQDSLFIKNLGPPLHFGSQTQPQPGSNAPPCNSCFLLVSTLRLSLSQQVVATPAGAAPRSHCSYSWRLESHVKEGLVNYKITRGSPTVLGTAWTWSLILQ